MTLVLTGTNGFALKAELRKITTKFVVDYGDFGLERIEAGEIELGRLLENVASLPFLAPRRMIILSDPSANKSINEHIDDLLSAVADTTDLIMVEAKFDKRLSLYKTLKKKASVKEFAELDERALPKWLNEEAKTRGGGLTLADATYLVQRVGTNQMALHNELDKLLIYQPVITRATIDLLTEQQPQSTVFDLLEAAFSGKTKKALEIYQEQRKQQVEPQAIMGMLAWQMHILAVVKANEKLGPDGIASAAKLNPFVVRKTMYLTSSQSLRDIKDLVKRVLDLDIRLKSEAIDADDAIQHLLLTI
ncbi:MAG: polymerase subunit delta [Candidatus Saccharibacteria bacterium]|nr:polymerase subunit delta [Candidatus Saccharibacteria bacterium]